LLVLGLLLLWQGWLTLGLFGPERDWHHVVDENPILSGRHPLHLYHGYLGARTLLERGTLSCYDPSFHAGYPKTPVFDGGSRPAELALALAGGVRGGALPPWTIPGGQFHAAAYKVGLAVFCWLVPVLLFAAARSAGLARGPACLVCLLGLLVWWGKPCQEALESGEVDLLFASLLLLAQAGFLVRYDRSPGAAGLVGVVVTGMLGWFHHPPLMAAVLPLLLVYYLSVGPRHGLSWHLSLLAGLVVTVAAHAFWLLDWVHYWWIRLPLNFDEPLVAHRTLRALWEAPLWGGPVDRLLACGLLLAGLGGVVLFNETRQRAGARLFGLAFATFVILALVGVVNDGLGRLGAVHLFVPGLLVAALPAGHALATLAGRLRQWTGTGLTPLLFPAALGLAGWLLFPDSTRPCVERLWQPAPLEIGLGARRGELVKQLESCTTEQARVLWEDQHQGRFGSRWTALLPVLTGRSFVGGLDADAGIEHTSGGLVDQVLAGRPVREWSDAELEDYCRRYNIGWVVCWSQEAQTRFRRWPGVDRDQAHPLVDNDQIGWLYRLRRQPSITLAGQATLRAADTRHILLSDVVPERSDPGEAEGQVVLCFHYQTGMRVTPSRVRLEKAEDSQDAIPFVRLRVSEPVGRVMITWESR
jgi:hypothetical protein